MLLSITVKVEGDVAVFSADLKMLFIALPFHNCKLNHFYLMRDIITLLAFWCMIVPHVPAKTSEKYLSSRVFQISCHIRGKFIMIAVKNPLALTLPWR